MANDKVATFGLNLQDGVSGPANAGADALEQLRAKVAAGSDALKNMNADLRRLRGNTEEVKGAKNELKAKIEAERNAVSSANLAILKQGGSYEALATAKRKAESLKAKFDADAAALAKERLDALKGSVAQAGGPLADLTGKFGSLGKVFGTSAGAAGVAVFAIGALIGVVVSLGAALVSSAVGFAKWVLESANAARSASLVREALLGSAQQAGALGSQIDALAAKLPTAKSALQDLSISLVKAKFSGQTLVDSFNAIGQASAAVGDDVGNKLRGILERGILPNGYESRFQINWQELLGTGLAVQDIAGPLASAMKISVEQARLALISGRVKLADGAAALRKAVEAKFGAINLRKMLDFNVLATKFKETLAGLTREINLEPLSQGLGKIVEQFGEGTVAGQAMKGIVTRIGDGLVKGLAAATPFVVQFIKGLVIGALEIEIAYYRLRNKLREVFGDSKILSDVDGMNLALTAGKWAAIGLAGAVVLVAGAIALLTAAAVAPIVAIAAPFIYLATKAYESYQRVKAIDWAGLGKSIVDGIVNGITSGATTLVEAMVKLATSAKDKFKDTLGIKSPSKVMADAAEEIPAGGVVGVKRGAPKFQDEIDRMIDVPRGAGAGSSAKAGESSKVENHFSFVFYVQGDGSGLAKQGSAFREQMTKALQELCAQNGFPVTVTS